MNIRRDLSVESRDIATGLDRPFTLAQLRRAQDAGILATVAPTRPLDVMLNVRVMKCLFVSLILAPALAGLLAAAEKTKSAANGGSDLFAPPQIVELQLTVGDSALGALKTDPKSYVKATVTEGEHAYANVGLRYKGSADSGKKPGFTVKFNEFTPGQKFHSQAKLVFDPAANDPTFLTEWLATDLFRAAGVPTPRIAFAVVTLNGKNLGLYVLSEGVNKDFLGRHFERAKGNLYEGDACDITGKLDKDSGDDSKTQPDVDALASAAKEPDSAQRWSKLAKVLDCDRFAAFLAAEVLTAHTGGYALGTNKYRIYHDPATGKMVFLPHGVNEAFTRVDLPIRPEVRGLVAQSFLASPDGGRLYREHLGKLVQQHFQVKVLQTRLDEMAHRLSPVLAKCDPAAGEKYEASVAQLRDRLAKRAYVLSQELQKSGN
jgi:spore coat protein CotH